VTDVKMRTFIAPGQTVELRVELTRQSAMTFTASLAARIDGKTAATGRVEIAAGDRS
jgi:3-hydroxymyristoyl/3-hydroxydecanoyl-(acyl carrier protein) dehydratase